MTKDPFKGFRELGITCHLAMQNLTKALRQSPLQKAAEHARNDFRRSFYSKANYVPILDEYGRVVSVPDENGYPIEIEYLRNLTMNFIPFNFYNNHNNKLFIYLGENRFVGKKGTHVLNASDLPYLLHQPKAKNWNYQPAYRPVPSTAPRAPGDEVWNYQDKKWETLDDNPYLAKSCLRRRPTIDPPEGYTYINRTTDRPSPEDKKWIPAGCPSSDTPEQGKWIPLTSHAKYYDQDYLYCKQVKPVHIPFTMETFEPHRGRYITTPGGSWRKPADHYDPMGIILKDTHYPWSVALETFIFEDGTPFGNLNA